MAGSEFKGRSADEILDVIVTDPKMTWIPGDVIWRARGALDEIEEGFKKGGTYNSLVSSFASERKKLEAFLDKLSKVTWKDFLRAKLGKANVIRTSEGIEITEDELQGCLKAMNNLSGNARDIKAFGSGRKLDEHFSTLNEVLGYALIKFTERSPFEPNLLLTLGNKMSSVELEIKMIEARMRSEHEIAMKEMRAQLQKLSDMIEKQKKELEEKDKALRQHEQKIEAAQEVLRQEIAAKQKEIERLGKELTTKSVKLTELTAQNRLLRDQVGELTPIAVNAKERIKAAEEKEQKANGLVHQMRLVLGEASKKMDERGTRRWTATGVAGLIILTIGVAVGGPLGWGALFGVGILAALVSGYKARKNSVAAGEEIQKALIASGSVPLPGASESSQSPLPIRSPQRKQSQSLSDIKIHEKTPIRTRERSRSLPDITSVTRAGTLFGEEKKDSVGGSEPHTPTEGSPRPERKR